MKEKGGVKHRQGNPDVSLCPWRDRVNEGQCVKGLPLKHSPTSTGWVGSSVSAGLTFTRLFEKAVGWVQNLTAGTVRYRDPGDI